MLPIRDPSTGQTDQFVNVNHLLTLFKAMGFDATYDTATNTLALTGPTPRPTYTKVTPQLYAEAVAQAQQAEKRSIPRACSGCSRTTPSGIPIRRTCSSTGTSTCRSSTAARCCRQWPWVVFLKGTAVGGNDTVVEVVGKGNNGLGLNGYAVIDEVVDAKTGNVTWIDQGYYLALKSQLQGANPPDAKLPNVGDFNFHSIGNWAYGYGLDIVPNLNWHTGINPVNP